MANSTTTELWKIIFKNVDPSWSSFFSKPNVSKAFYTCLSATVEVINEKKMNINSICPNINYVLFPFILCNKKDLKVIIFGQDPYPKHIDACGAAFSVLNPSLIDRHSIPSSMEAIYKSLAKFKHTSEQGQKGCLYNLLSQGVLLFNATPIILINDKIKIQLKSQWEYFTAVFIKELSIEHPELVYVLFGNDAKDLKYSINDFRSKTQYIYETHHPSPMANTRLPEEKKFENIDHFTEINKLCKFNINWNLEQETVIYIDGATPGNNNSDINARKGGYAVVFAEGPYKGKIFYQNVSRITKITNNRCELYGLIQAFQICLKQQFIGKLTIYTDSEYVYNMITSYVYTWDEEKIQTMKNTDLFQTIKIYSESIEKYYARYGGCMYYRIPRNSNIYATLADKYAKESVNLNDDNVNVIEVKFE
jgi:uracil-DNA glycosylase